MKLHAPPKARRATPADSVRGRVVLIGWQGAPPRTPGDVAPVRLQPSDVGRTPIARSAAVVLGRAAVEELHPADVRAALGRSVSRAVIGVDSCDASALSRWVKAGFRVVREGDLETFLSPRPLAARPPAPLEVWGLSAPAAQSGMERALSVLPTLAHLSVGEWAAAIPVTERAFFDLCTEWSGLAPKELLTRYRLFVAMHARARGATLDKCADAAGYADVPSLLRACRRRHVVMPPAGPRVP